MNREHDPHCVVEDEFYDDDHTEDPEPLERSWQEIAADEACVTLYGAL